MNKILLSVLFTISIIICTIGIILMIIKKNENEKGPLGKKRIAGIILCSIGLIIYIVFTVIFFKQYNRLPFNNNNYDV